MRISKRFVIVASLGLFWPQGLLGAQPESTQPTTPRKVHDKITRDRVLSRHDAPGGAAEHFALKRQGPADGATIHDRYAAARKQMANLPVHSLSLGGTLPPATRFSPAGAAQVQALKALGTWTTVGPGNIGGRTRTLIIHPDDAQTIYAGAVSGGIWKTTNGGQIWAAIGDELSNIAVNSMVMDAIDPEVLYAGTGEGYFREEVRGTWLPLRGAGIFKTTNGGGSWHQLETTSSEDFHWVNDLLISPHDRQRIYAATRSGVWTSSDSGETWQQVLESTAKGGCLDLAMRTDTADDWLFASCGTLEQATVYRNTDAAGSGAWQAVLSEPAMSRTTLAVAPSEQSIIYALAASNVAGPGGRFDQGLHAVYRSDQGGDPGSWQVQVSNTDPDKLNTLLLTNAAAASYLDCGWSDSNRWITMGWYCNVIAVDPADPDIVWAAGVDLFRSDNGGRDWGLASYWWLDDDYQQYVHADQHAIVFHPDYDGSTNRTIFSASDGGVFRSFNARAPVAQGAASICDPYASGMSWASLNHNFGATQFYHGAVYPGGDRFIGGAQDNGTVTGFASDGIDGWYPVLGGDGGYVAIDPLDTTTLYAEYQWAAMRKSTNGGWSFSDATYGLNEPSSNFLFITPFTMDTNDPGTLWIGGRKLWRTTNGAASWHAASLSFPSDGRVSAVAVAPGDSNTVVVGTTDGTVYRHRSALSTTATTLWESSRPRQGFVSWLAFDPVDTDVLWATYAGFGGEHLYRSSDFGTTWQTRDGSGAFTLPDIPVHSVVVDPNLPRRLFLGTDLGVFTSTDSGSTWQVENTGFAAAVTESLSLAYDGQGNALLFAFTHGRGAWRVALDPGLPGPRRGAGGRIRP